MKQMTLLGASEHSLEHPWQRWPHHRVGSGALSWGRGCLSLADWLRTVGLHDLTGRTLEPGYQAVLG